MLPHTIDELPDGAFIRRPLVEALCGKRHSSLYADIQEKRFPAPVKIGRSAVGWRLGDIRAWLKNPSAWAAESAGGGGGNS